MEPTAAPETTSAEQRIASEHELDVDRRKQQKGKGPVGSLENPEVYENVPGHVIPILEHEFEDFDGEADKFLAGETPEDQFIGFRLRQGVYGQRQPDVQMVRVKLPMGGVTPEQMDAFASVVEKFAPLRKGHITTRQNIQIHHVPLTEMKELIREISAVGLSSREGCGNTVRNVTGDPYAGVAHDEPFDITPYAGAYVRYFVRHPTTQLMPRKIKTAFTATDEDVAITRIHDIGFVPKLRDGVRGVEMRGRRRDLDHAPGRPHAVRVRRARQRRLPEGHRGVPADLRPPGVAAGQPGPGADQGAGRQGRDRRLSRAGRGRAGGRVGRGARLLARSAAVRRRRGAQRAGRPRGPLEPERRSLRVRALLRGERRPAAPGRVLDRDREGDPRRPAAGAVPRPGRDHARVHGRLRAHHGAAEPRPALGPRRGRL